MGKYLQMLNELHQPEEESQKPLEKEVTKPTKTLLPPFVSANNKDIQFVSYGESQGGGPKNQELTEPAKGIAGIKNHKATEQEIAEHRINRLKLHDDRVFVRQKLIGFYGSKRLDIVEKYFEQWQLGVESEPVQIKQDNAGRHRANAWLRNTDKRS